VRTWCRRKRSPAPQPAVERAEGQDGRPTFVDPPDGLDVSVAHTDDLVVCATRHVRCGIDVERGPARSELFTMVPKLLTRSERRRLDAARP
jgi:phosphopantetheinyl transferase